MIWLSLRRGYCMCSRSLPRLFIKTNTLSIEWAPRNCLKSPNPNPAREGNPTILHQLEKVVNWAKISNINGRKVKTRIIIPSARLPIKSYRDSRCNLKIVWIIRKPNSDISATLKLQKCSRNSFSNRHFPIKSTVSWFRCKDRWVSRCRGKKWLALIKLKFRLWIINHRFEH